MPARRLAILLPLVAACVATSPPAGERPAPAAAAGIAPRDSSPPAATVGLQAGPMVGYSEMREVLLWVQTTGPARVRFAYWDTTEPARRYHTAETTTTAAEAFTARLVADSVQPGRGYGYELQIDGVAVPRPYPLRFTSQPLWQWRTDPPPFRIALGSCFYVNEPAFDRPGQAYGGDYQILGHIHAMRPDLMLWLGDNTYLREADWWSRTGILHRYTHTRSLPELQPLLGSTHHYAIWDDHDYGPNDSDRSFREKATTREAFRLFWGNPAHGLPPGYGADEGGIAYTFEWNDVQFFMLDDRWFRAPNRLRGERRLLGEAQMRWLLDALASSRAPFKLVAMGGQVINPFRKFENYANYAEERQALIDRITAEGIPGVVFLSGDRHHTELSRLERPGTYPLYDLTVSPLTAGPAQPADTNATRVPGTLVTGRNFATVDVSGPRTDRRMLIRVFDADGREKWQRTIAASELR